jgi:hypothetical protein
MIVLGSPAEAAPGSLLRTLRERDRRQYQPPPQPVLRPDAWTCWMEPGHRGRPQYDGSKFFICDRCDVTWYGGREHLPA